MSIERKLTLIYFVLGVAVGIASAYLSVIYSMVLISAVYVASLVIVRQLIHMKEKFSWVLMNTLVTFLLVWIVTWMLLYNLG